MNIRGKRHKKLVKMALSKPGVKTAYEALEPEFALIRDMVEIRNKLGKTQEDIAAIMHTPTSVVGRLEADRGRLKHSPTIATLKKYATAIDCDLRMILLPRKRRCMKIK